MWTFEGLLLFSDELPRAWKHPALGYVTGERMEKFTSHRATGPPESRKLLAESAQGRDASHFALCLTSPSGDQAKEGRHARGTMCEAVLLLPRWTPKIFFFIVVKYA